MLKNLWNDEAGLIISAELVLVLTIGVIAMVVGLSSVRDAVITELADVAQAIANVDQSYSVLGATGHSSSVAGFQFVDAQDFCDSTTANGNDGNSKCVAIIGIGTEGVE